MGAQGALELALRQPKHYKAVVLASGYIDKEDPDLKSVQKHNPDKKERLWKALGWKPVWLFHSSTDSVVDVKNSDVIAKVLNEGKDIGDHSEHSEVFRYTRYESAPEAPDGMSGGGGPGHASWERAWLEEGLWEWVHEIAFGRGHLR